ncbi:MAG: Fructose-6-phosphate aldolase 1 [Pseudomonadota bacterium]
MNIYLDSAQVSTWTLPPGCPAVQGVTTNPSLVYQAGLPVTLATYLRLLQAAGDHGMAELMLQLPANDPVQALNWLAQLHPAAEQSRVRLTIKLPCHPDWLPCIRAVQQTGQAVLLTGLSNPVQLLWAQSLQVAYVAPYVGRLAADGRDVWALMQACVAVQAHQPAGPALLAASIKSPDVLARLIGCGAAAVTLPPASLIAWAGDALTQSAMAQFDRDVAASLSLPG